MLLKRPTHVFILFLYLLVLAQGLFSLTSCDDKKKISHPTEINKAPLKTIDYTISSERSRFWIDSTDLELITSIGISSGKKEYVIGRIADLGIHKDQVILLDEQSNHLRSFDSKTGDFIQQFGKPGKGPGDLMYPMEVSINDSLIFVSDRLLKAEIFKFTDNKYENYDQISLAFSPYDICTIGNLLFLSGYAYGSNKSTVHKYDFISKKKLSSFHPPYKTANQFVKSALSKNRVSCNSKSQTVIVIPRYLPYIYGYDLTGNIKWAAKLNQYYYQSIVESANGAIAIGVNREGHTDFLKGFIPLDSTSYQIFQISRIERKNRKMINSMLLTYLIDTRDGGTQLISENLPLIKSIKKGQLISFTLEKGYPEIKIFRIHNESLRSLYH